MSQIVNRSYNNYKKKSLGISRSLNRKLGGMVEIILQCQIAGTVRMEGRPFELLCVT